MYSGVGVTFIIPRDDQRPGSPLVGYHCVYESYFEDDTRLWFPIPQLAKSYVFRRGVAISQFLNGSYQIMVALIMMAADIGISLNVRALEELTFVRSMPRGLYSLRMRPNYNIITGHPNKTKLWQHFYFYIKSDESAFEDPPPDEFHYLWNYQIGRSLFPIFLFFFWF